MFHQEDGDGVTNEVVRADDDQSYYKLLCNRFLGEREGSIQKQSEIPRALAEGAATVLACLFPLRLGCRPD